MQGHQPQAVLPSTDPRNAAAIRGIDRRLFGPLLEGPSKERWILIPKDSSSRWIELFALVSADAETCV